MNYKEKFYCDIADFIKVLSSYKTDSSSVDFCHNLLIFSTVLSHKPKNILEVGYGSGFVTTSLVEAIKINNVGNLTLVDNWRDWNYEMPKFIKNIDKNIKLVTSDEKSYISSCKNDEYDLIIQDASHKNFSSNFENYKRITKNKGIIFFHDSSMFDVNLLGNHSFVNFAKSSIEGERCERGLLMFINNKF